MSSKRRSEDRVVRVWLSVTLALTAAAVARVGVRADVDAELTSACLWLFLLLFVTRVAGQVVVALRGPRWLPPMEEWHHVPYRILLPTQLLLIALLAWVAAGSATGRVLVGPHAAQIVVVLSYLYAGSMALRYAWRMLRRPDQRWWGGTIPIVFHVVLAAYAHTLGSYGARA